MNRAYLSFDSFEEGCRVTLQAVQAILDGKDDGTGISNEPWHSIRIKLIELVGDHSQFANRE